MCPDTALAQLSPLPLRPADSGTELMEKGNGTEVMEKGNGTELVEKGKLLSPRGCDGCGRQDLAGFTLIRG